MDHTLAAAWPDSALHMQLALPMGLPLNLPKLQGQGIKLSGCHSQSTKRSGLHRAIGRVKHAVACIYH
jgi:hypothetical protein